jgi:putative methyltransferase (TIGR04325 family)
MQLIRKIVNRALWALPSSGTIRGYESDELIDFIFAKSTNYNEFAPWPEMAGVATVLDFGGGFGSHYQRASQSCGGSLRWAVVETPETVARAAGLVSDNLRFFANIDAAAAWLGAVDIIYSNAAIQCTPEPERYVAELCAIGARRMLWDRTLLSEGERRRHVQISLLAENGPGVSFSRKRVETPMIRMAERTFMEAHSAYELTSRIGRQDNRDGEDFAFTIRE